MHVYQIHTFYLLTCPIFVISSKSRILTNLAQNASCYFLYKLILYRSIALYSFANLIQCDHQPYFSRQQTAFAIEFQHRVFLADQILCSNKIKDVPLEYCQFYFRQLNIVEQLFIRIRFQNCNGFRLAIVIERDDDDFKIGWTIFTRKVLSLEYHIVLL